MADVYRKSLNAACVILLLATYVEHSLGLVHELNKGNIDKFLKGKLLTLTFIDSPSCTRCRILFPFFVAASQVFPHDPEIFFTRTHDKLLQQKWGITELPAIIYHKVGVKNHEQIHVDVTVDDIIDEIARIMYGNFEGLTRTYSVHVDDKNFNELIVTPKQSVLMLLHDKDDARERTTIENVANTFKKDDAVLFASLDVVKYKTLRDNTFMTRETPVMMWFPPDEKKSPKRFGGMLSHQLLTRFVNERTGLQRELNGELKKEAGRIREVDKIVDNNIVKVMEGTPEEMKFVLTAVEDLQDTVERQHAEMLEYYLYVLENIAAAIDEKPVKEILKDVEKRLSGKEGTILSTKQQEAVKRKRNIINYFQDLEKKYSKEKQSRTKEEIQEEIDLQIELAEAKAKKAREHIHEHEEL